MEAPKATRWYGWQTLGTDGAAIAILAPAFVTRDTGAQQALLLSAITTYSFSAPVVHFAHGAVGKGFADLGIRVGMPLLLGLVSGAIGSATYRPSPDARCDEGGALSGPPAPSGSCPIDANGRMLLGFFIGGFAGSAGAMALDAAVLAHEPLHRDEREDEDARQPSQAPRPAPAITRIEPTFRLTPERTGGAQATLGLIGIF